jgi:hypothetical protein
MITMSNLPYRPARKPAQYSHGFSQSWGPVWGFLGVLAALGVFGLWPAFFFHGEKQDAFTGQEHWAWDIHSTVACGIWWGILLLAGIMLSAGSPRTPEKSPPDFPDLRHLHGNPFLEPPAGVISSSSGGYGF